jgi:serine/threonine protein kinase
MVLVVGHIQGMSEDEADNQRVEVWVETQPGATIGWVLSRVVEEMEVRNPAIPTIVGLRILRSRERHCGASPRKSARRDVSGQMLQLLGYEEENLDNITLDLIVDYGEPVDALLNEGDCLECLFDMVDDFGSDSRRQPKDGVGIGDFSIVRVLGYGASSRVVQVSHKNTGQMHAIKVISKKRIMSNVKELERIVTEKRVLAKLSHPFVVSMQWSFQTAGHLFFVLDYCAGGELFYHLQQKGRFTEPDSRFYISEILLGLEYLHKQGVLYRDLKLENCLLDLEGHVNLTDFGLSRDNLTEDCTFDSVVGTVIYLPPEMIRREGHGLPLDYYCLGCCLSLLLTGSVPHFKEGNVQQLCQKRAQNMGFKVPGGCTVNAGAFLKRLLQPDPQQRLCQASDAKVHPWMMDVDFEKVYNKEPQPIFPSWPPIAPYQHPGLNFDPELLEVPMPSEFLSGVGSPVGDTPHIAGFSKVDNY